MSELSELFDRDPLQRTREDIKDIITAYRADRQRFLLGEKKPKSAASPKIDLDSLDI